MRIRISSNFAPFIRDLRVLTAPLRSQASNRLADLSYLALRSEGSQHSFRLERSGVVVRLTEKPLALLGSLHWDVFNEWRARLRSELLIHGCAVGREGKALLFIGTRNTGKTTVSTYLTVSYTHLTLPTILRV